MKKISITIDLEDINVLCLYTSNDDEIKNLEIKVDDVENE